MDTQKPAGVVIAPMGIGEVLDTGFTLARRSFRSLLLVAAWGLVPAYSLYVLADPAFVSGASPSTALPVFLVVVLILSLAGALAYIAVTLACARLVAPNEISAGLAPGPLYRAAVGRLGHLILWGILVFVLAIPLMILFPLGLYFLVRWCLSWEVLIIERIGPIASLRRSWSLTRGAWWHTFVVLLAATIIFFFLGAAIGSVFGVIGGILTIVLDSVVLVALFSTLGSLLAALFLTPFSIAIFVVLYYELRARTEGFDLEQRARELTTAE